MELLPIGMQVGVVMSEGKTKGVPRSVRWRVNLSVGNLATIVAHGPNYYPTEYGVHYNIKVGTQTQWVPDYAIAPINMSEDVSEWE